MSPQDCTGQHQSFILNKYIAERSPCQWSNRLCTTDVNLATETPRMDLSTIQEIRNLSVLKTTRKLMEKLFQMHRNGKISSEDYVLKLEKLKGVVESSIDEVERNSETIRLRSRPVDQLHVFIVEHFEHVGCFETADMLARRFSIEEYSDRDFYRQIHGMRARIEEGEFEDALGFCKEYRSELKGSRYEDSCELENNLKIEKFIRMCHSHDHDKALEFVNREFKRVPEQIKSYLPVLVSNSAFRKYPPSGHSKVADQFQRCALALFRRGEKSRLTQRIEYGMMAYRTYRCTDRQSRGCPTCCKALRLREDVPFNKHEISILLCRGSSEEMDDTNQPYAFENGLVYGAKHIESVEHICIISRSADNPSRYPKLCFIL